jgi:hypothetical protein
VSPEEIRKHWNVQGAYPAELIGDFALIEIAAQLSELNQHAYQLVNALFTLFGSRP